MKSENRSARLEVTGEIHTDLGRIGKGDGSTGMGFEKSKAKTLEARWPKKS